MVSLIALLAVSIESVAKEHERGNGSRGNFGGNKTVSDSHMHHRGGGGESMQRGDMMIHALRNPEVAEKIGLSEEQCEKISRKIEKLEDKNLNLKYKMEKTSLKQARLMTAKELDEKALMDAVEELGKYRTQIAKQRITMMIFMRNTLTPEQTKNMRSVMRERMNERRKDHSEDWRRNAKKTSENKQEMTDKRHERMEAKERKREERKEVE